MADSAQRTAQSEPAWHTDEGQRACVERAAAEQGVEPYDLLQRWAFEHGQTAQSAENTARNAKRSQEKCLGDAHRWYGRLPVDQVEVGATVWVYLIASNEGWEYVRCEVVGKGTTTTDLYGDVPNLRLRHSEGEFDWTPKPSLLVDIRRPA